MQKSHKSVVVEIAAVDSIHAAGVVNGKPASIIVGWNKKGEQVSVLAHRGKGGDWVEARV